MFAEENFKISDDDIKIIYHESKTLLFNGNSGGLKDMVCLKRLWQRMMAQRFLKLLGNYY